MGLSYPLREEMEEIQVFQKAMAVQVAQDALVEAVALEVLVLRAVMEE